MRCVPASRRSHSPPAPAPAPAAGRAAKLRHPRYAAPHPAAHRRRAGYGVPYTTLTADALPAGAAGVRSLLWDTPGAAAKFSALVMHPDVETIGSLSQAQIRELQDFQRRSGARALKFGAPPASLGMQAGACAAGKETEAMRFTSSTPYGVSGVRPDAVLSFQDIWRCGGLNRGKLRPRAARAARGGPGARGAGRRERAGLIGGAGRGGE